MVGTQVLLLIKGDVLAEIVYGHNEQLVLGQWRETKLNKGRPACTAFEFGIDLKGDVLGYDLLPSLTDGRPCGKNDEVDNETSDEFVTWTTGWVFYASGIGMDDVSALVDYQNGIVRMFEHLPPNPITGGFGCLGLVCPRLGIIEIKRVGRFFFRPRLFRSG